MLRFRQWLSRHFSSSQHPATLARALAAGVFALALAGGSCISRANATGYKIVDLGSLGGPSAFPRGINQAGIVVGYSWTNSDISVPARSFLYDGTGMHDLSTLLGDPGYSVANITDAGQLLGSTPDGHAFYYDGAVHDLGFLGGEARACARFMNKKGHLAGTAAVGLLSRAFFLDGSRVRDLGSLPGCPYVTLMGMNDADQIVGWAYGDGSHAFRWENGVLQDLGTLGGPKSAAYGINHLGQIVGVADTTAVGHENNPARHAFLYDSTGMHDLGTLGGKESFGWAINNQGAVVGISDLPSTHYDWPMHPFVYSNGVMQDLIPLLLTGSNALPWDGNNVRPVAITDSGTILLSAYRGGYNNMRSYLLVPTAAPRITLDRGSIAFGSQAPGTIGAAQTVTITNSGDAPLIITAAKLTGADSASFSITKDSGETVLAPGASRRIMVVFRPLGGGNHFASLTIDDNDEFGTSSHRVDLSGTGSVSGLSLVPQNGLDVGAEPVGATSDTYTVKLTNSGEAPLLVHRTSVAGENGSEFSVTDLGGVTIPAGEARVITVYFTPTARGRRNATLVVDCNAPQSPVQMPLTGVGLAPELRVSPTAVDFGKEPVGLSGPLAVLLQNTGDAPLLVRGASFTGPNAAEFTLASSLGPAESLQPGDIILLNVRFSPVATGNRAASLVIDSDAASGPATIALTGVGAAPLLVLNATGLVFSLHPAADGSSTQTLTLTNNGDAPLNIDKLSLSGPSAGSFQIVSDTGEKSLAPGASRTVTLAFSPAATASVRSAARIATAARIAAASYSAVLEIHHNDPHPGSPHQISLTAVDTGSVMPPAAPTGLTATVNGANQVALAWTDHSSNETAFAIWRQTGGGAFERVGVVAPNHTAFIDAGAAPKTAYTYEVRATNDFYASTWSNQATVTTPTPVPPAAPAGLKVVNAAAGKVTLGWTDNSSNEAAFEIWRKSAGGSYVFFSYMPANSTGFSDLTVSPSTSYTYTIRAINTPLASSFTPGVTVTTPAAPPAAPTGLKAVSVSANQVKLGWTDNSSSEAAFEIWRKTAGGSYVFLSYMPANATGFSDPTVSPATSYTYTIRAINTPLASPFTPAVTVTTPAALTELK
jgi:probable HAF family extracellular repeat protein